MSTQSNAAQRRALAIAYMEKALAELDADEDAIVAMRLQHALDVARGEEAPQPSVEDSNFQPSPLRGMSKA